MQALFAVAALLLLGIAVFAFQNPDPVTVRFLHWQVSASVAVLTLVATASGALATALASLAARLVRWSRRPGAARAGSAPGPDSSPPEAL
jgi:uncharacterized integral membrane protein